MGDPVVTDDSQVNETPAAQKFGKEGRERPTPNPTNAIRSFSPSQNKPFAETTEGESTEFENSSTGRDMGVGHDTTKEMRTRQDTTDRTGPLEETTQENFLPSPAARVTGPYGKDHSNPGNQEVERKSSGAVAVAAAAYYYCTVTVRNVRSLIGTAGTYCCGHPERLSRLYRGSIADVTVRYVPFSEVVR